MTKLTKHELAIASNVVLWFVGHYGEASLDSLSGLTGVLERRLASWAAARGYLWGDGDTISMSALPLVWEAFASESRSCQAFNEAFAQLKVTSDDSSPFMKWVASCASDLRLVG